MVAVGLAAVTNAHVLLANTSAMAAVCLVLRASTSQAQDLIAVVPARLASMPAERATPVAPPVGLESIPHLQEAQVALPVPQESTKTRPAKRLAYPAL